MHYKNNKHPNLKFIVWGIFSLLLSIDAYASSLITLDNSNPHRAIGQNVDYLEDVTGNLTIDDVTKSEIADQFKPSEMERPSFGYTGSTYWFRFHVANNSDDPNWFLTVKYPPLDYIDLYQLKIGGGHTHFAAGDLRPFGYRDIKNNQTIFPIDTSGNANGFYLRVETESSMTVPISVLSGKHLLEAVGVNNYVQGAYLGVMFVMAFYNLFIFLSVRDKSYLYYVLFIVTMTVFQLILNGYANQFLWPGYTWWGNVSTIFSVSLSLAFAFLFTQTYLNTKLYTPNINNIITAIVIIAMINSFMSLLVPYRMTVIIIIFLAVFAPVFAIFAGFIALKKGCRPARYYLWAWTALIFSIVLFALKLFGVVPNWFLLDYVIQIGCTIDVIILSLGLADRINILKTEALIASESANKLKDEFLSTITHELLTPLNGIRLSLSLLKPEVIGKDSQEYLETADVSSNHLLSIIESLFMFTEARRGTLALNNSEFNIRTLLKNYFTQYVISHNGHRNEMVFEIDDNFPEWIVGDEKMLIAIVDKLMKNASEYTENGKVTLHCKTQEKQGSTILNLSVIDTGAGISKVIQSTICESFTQADNSLNRIHGGLGIGLTLVNDVLSLMGGNLDLESTVGSGSTFTLHIPVDIAVPPENERVPTIRADSLSDTVNVLVVEDNPVNMTLLCKILKKSGFSPLSAANGKLAIEVLKNNPDIKAVLMDCQMPVMDGFEATTIIRGMNEFAGLPIIAVTANVSEVDKQRCRDSGMNDYLPKPVKRELIKLTLDKWVSEYESRKLSV